LNLKNKIPQMNVIIWWCFLHQSKFS